MEFYVACSPSAPDRLKIGLSNDADRRVAHLSFTLVMLGLGALKVVHKTSGTPFEMRALERELRRGLANFRCVSGSSREVFSGLSLNDILERLAVALAVIRPRRP